MEKDIRTTSGSTKPAERLEPYWDAHKFDIGGIMNFVDLSFRIRAFGKADFIVWRSGWGGVPALIGLKQAMKIGRRIRGERIRKGWESCEDSRELYMS